MALLTLLPGGVTRAEVAGHAQSAPSPQSVQDVIIPKNPNAAKDAVYACPEAANPAAQVTRAQSLAVETYDKNKLACAADLYYQAASSSAADPAIRVAAVAAQIAYLREIGTEHDADLLGQQTAEWDIRLAHGDKQAGLLCASTAHQQATDSALSTVCAEADLLAHRYDDPKDYVAAVRRVIPTLTAVSEHVPQTLDGLDLVYLGDLYFDLPTIFGGNSAKAVVLLERARQYAPRDPARLSDLAKGYEAEGRTQDTKAVLRELVALNASDGSLQSMADAWLLGEGLAARLEDPAMEAQFEGKRHRLFAANPKVQTRLTSAIGGHGGANPLTGKPQY